MIEEFDNTLFAFGIQDNDMPTRRSCNHCHQKKSKTGLCTKKNVRIDKLMKAKLDFVLTRMYWLIN